jgi:hypothetical protein
MVWIIAPILKEKESITATAGRNSLTVFLSEAYAKHNEATPRSSSGGTWTGREPGKSTCSDYGR